MPRVDLVYDVECPNVGTARANLMRGFALAGLKPAWCEHRIGDPAAPVTVRGYGSPTILVDGRDVAGVLPTADACCRLYTDKGRRTGAPPVEQIARMLVASRREVIAFGRFPAWTA
jgi:mercuric ion transport protein